jgi:hypothetical protein
MPHGKREAPMTKPDFGCLLRTLTEHGVDFLVVGEVGAILQGATLSTFDLDIVHSTEPANITRLLAALGDLDAYYRAQPEKRLRPSQTDLSSPGHQLLMTRFGPLDVLGSIGKGRRYQDLLPHAAEMTIGEGLRIRVLPAASPSPARRSAARNKKSPISRSGFYDNPGNFLLSHTLARAVPSGLKGLTSVFGMGTGGSLSLWSPRNWRLGAIPGSLTEY